MTTVLKHFCQQSDLHVSHSIKYMKTMFQTMKTLFQKMKIVFWNMKTVFKNVWPYSMKSMGKKYKCTLLKLYFHFKFANRKKFSRALTYTCYSCAHFDKCILYVCLLFCMHACLHLQIKLKIIASINFALHIHSLLESARRSFEGRRWSSNTISLW